MAREARERTATRAVVERRAETMLVQLLELLVRCGKREMKLSEGNEGKTRLDHSATPRTRSESTTATGGMPISSTVYRQAATAVQRTLSSKSPYLRTAASTPPHPRHWVQLARPTKDYTPRFDPAAPPVPRLSTLVLPKPPFQELRDLATFAYVKAAPLPPARGAGEAAERPGVSAGRKRGRVSPSFAGREVRFPVFLPPLRSG